MHISSAIKNFTQVSLLGVLLAFCLSVSTCAAGEVIITEGMVCVDKDGIVEVCVRDQYYTPSNGRGLLRSGQIADGDPVRVRIVYDKRYEFRGHVTVLK